MTPKVACKPILTSLYDQQIVKKLFGRDIEFCETSPLIIILRTQLMVV